MSDLEKQASTWVPPWQRPAAKPASDSPPNDLREAAEQAAARWSSPATDEDTADAPESAAPTDSPEAGGDPSTPAAPEDGAETSDGPTATTGGAAADRSDAAGGDGAATDGRSSRIPGSRGSEQRGARDSGENAATGGSDVEAEELGGAVLVDAAGPGADGGPGAEGGAAKKARSKKAAGDGASLKDGLAVAEMLAKALPEQRSKPQKIDADADGDAEVEEEEDEEPENYREYEPGEFKAALEAILMVVDEPVGELVLATVLEVRAEDVANALIDLSASYTQEGRGFDLRRAAGGWRFYTRADYSSYVERFVLDGQQLRLTQASLETLAVVAYKQPVTRARISAIRGVNVDGVIRTLITRGMVEECGADPDSGGHLYRTTTLFLEKMSLDSVEQLPPLAPFLPDNLEELANGE